MERELALGGAHHVHLYRLYGVAGRMRMADERRHGGGALLYRASILQGRASMKALIVVNREDEWPHDIPGAAVASAKAYLTGPAANSEQYRQVVNLCRCVRTDDTGFYVS